MGRGLGLIVNLIVFAMLRRGDSHDMNIAAASLHVISDLLGSAAAVLAGVVILITGWLPIDPLLSLFVSVLIVRSALALVRRSAHILMEGAPDWLDVGELRRTLEQRIPAIRDVHHVHAWLVGPQETLLTMHASVSAAADHAVVLKDAKVLLAERFGITHATIQIEVEDCVDEDCAGKGSCWRLAAGGERSGRILVGLQHPPLQFAFGFLHLCVAHFLRWKIRLADRDADLRERRRDHELVPGLQDPRRLRGVGDRHDCLATDLRREDRSRLEFEARPARAVRRDAGRDPSLTIAW